jgi:cAMP-dependent protein kinase regulator
MEEDKQYLKNNVQPVLALFLKDALAAKPGDVVGYLKQWIDSNGERVRKELEEKKKGKSSVPDTEEDPHQDLSEEEEDEEEIGELAPKLQIMDKNKFKKARTSVSAEAFGTYNKKEQFKPKVIPKSEEQIERIRARLSNSFMFSALEEKEQKIVIDAMDERKVE